MLRVVKVVELIFGMEPEKVKGRLRTRYSLTKYSLEMEIFQ